MFQNLENNNNCYIIIINITQFLWKILVLHYVNKNNFIEWIIFLWYVTAHYLDGGPGGSKLIKN